MTPHELLAAAFRWALNPINGAAMATFAYCLIALCLVGTVITLLVIRWP